MIRSTNREALSSNPRATLEAWNRFSIHICAAMYVFPKVHTITPTTLSPSTFVSRARDAIRGAIEFGYVENPEAMASWYAGVALWYVGKKVYIGPKGKKPKEPLEVKDEGAFVFGMLTPPELEAFALLLVSGRIVGPVKVLRPPKTYTIPPSPNLQILNQPDGSLILL